MKMKINNQNGFSLVEVMVTVFIFSIIAAGMLAVVLAGSRNLHTNKIAAELNQELRKSMEWMKYELQQAGSSSILDVPSDGTWHDSISFKTPSGVSAGSIQWNADYIQFALQSGTQNLLRTVSGTSKVLATDIQSVQFRRLSSRPNILEVLLVAQKDVPTGDDVQSQMTFQVNLRNK